ncbi:MAG: hypothetical protein D6717_05575 [Gammaproteobacteria bacterium]|nr:MAG: hypothetical protein D6717_05575 [Gammaproteobacteria bacterium]
MFSKGIVLIPALIIVRAHSFRGHHIQNPGTLVPQNMPGDRNQRSRYEIFGVQGQQMNGLRIVVIHQ